MGADRNDDHVGSRCGTAEIIGERQATAGDAVGDQLRKPRLVERDTPVAQRRQSTWIGIDASHVVLPLSEARTRDEPNVAQADYGDTHSLLPPSAEASVLRLVRGEPRPPQTMIDEPTRLVMSPAVSAPGAEN
jgi:hypothetical protein